MQSFHRLCIVSSHLGLVLTMAPHGHMILLPPASSLQSGWLMNGDLPKTFQLYLSLSLMMKGNETFKVYIHHFVLGLHTFYTNYNVIFLVEVMQFSQLAIFPCLLKWSVGCVHFLRFIPQRQLWRLNFSSGSAQVCNCCTLSQVVPPTLCHLQRWWRPAPGTGLDPRQAGGDGRWKPWWTLIVNI